MEIIDFVEVTRNITTTAAGPVVCKASNGLRYFTKFCEGVEGPKELVNEYVGYKLAKLLRLPIPNAKLIRFNDSTEIYIKDKMTQISAGSIAFGSEELNKVVSVTTEDILSSCDNKDVLLSIIVFDHLIGNQDREYNYANLLYRYKDKVIFIIDHGRIFDIGTLWNEISCEQRKNAPIELKHFDDDSIYGRILNVIDINEYLDDCRNRFKNVNYNDIKSIFDEIPNEWNLSQNERIAGTDFIWTRINRYEEVLQKLLGLKR